MEAGDLAAVVVAVVSLVATAVCTVAAGALLRTMRELREVLDTLRRETEPLVDDLRLTVDQAGSDLQRMEGILESAERITSTVDTASQLTYRALSPPLIKTMSFVAGVRRAGRRLRGHAPLDVVDAAAVPAARRARRPGDTDPALPVHRRRRGRRTIEAPHARKERRR